MLNEESFVKNYYQGIYLTETIMGNPNGDFIDNSPRNFDGKIFTTDKCIKYNVRKYMHDTIEDLENKENIVFFFPRLDEGSSLGDNKFKARNDAFKMLFDNEFDELKSNSPDVRMFGGTFSFKDNDSKQIYGPIQLSYGIDINNAQIKRVQIGAPFATETGKQTTNGSEAIVDDAIISYDITINPNNHPNLLLNDDVDLFKKSLWFGTNQRKSTSKKTDSKFLMLVKFKNNSTNDKVTAISIGELNKTISIANEGNKKMDDEVIKLDCSKLSKKLSTFNEYIDSIDIIYDEDDIELINDDFEYAKVEPKELLGK